MMQLEILAVAFGLANITLLVRRSIWNFPCAIIMVSLYAVIFFEQRLYAEAGLQLFFAAVNLYGWWLWRRAGGTEEPVAVRWLSWPARIAWLAFIVVATFAIGTLLQRQTDAALPYPDAAIAAASVAAQFMLSFRRVENWLLWIAIDAAAIPLYIARELPLTAGLYAIFLVLSVLGLREWVGALRRPERLEGASV